MSKSHSNELSTMGSSTASGVLSTTTGSAVVASGATSVFSATSSFTSGIVSITLSVLVSTSSVASTLPSFSSSRSISQSSTGTSRVSPFAASNSSSFFSSTMQSSFDRLATKDSTFTMSFGSEIKFLFSCTETSSLPSKKGAHRPQSYFIFSASQQLLFLLLVLVCTYWLLLSMYGRGLFALVGGRSMHRKLSKFVAKSEMNAGNGDGTNMRDTLYLEEQSLV